MNQGKGKITLLYPLLTLLVLALCLLGVLLTGAGVYSRLVDRGERLFQDRIGLQYVATRVRQGQNVTVEDFEGVTALAFREETEGECYITRVYLWDGYIRELYCEADASMEPGDGEKVLPAGMLSLSLKDGILTVETEGGQLRLSLREGKEVSP